ncbi:phage virion morphogenesis protein [Cupriavidus sp. D384]|uniref:phage virion morphogenesis protein n=1 Tax=Cupriavidus sp. D384 TaxID=1538095 RepID=UPI00082DF6B4|nr:phage virion morphogenesis protein [Cupriavidus sp. D384]
MNDLEELTAWAGALVQKLDARQRRALMRAVVTELRRRQTARIAAQRNPDGSAYEPRKPQLRKKQGRLRQTMFARLRMARTMKARSDAGSAVVLFAGYAGRVAAVHQYGLRDRVNPRAGLEVKYARRELLGFGEGDLARLADAVVRRLSE